VVRLFAWKRWRYRWPDRENGLRQQLLFALEAALTGEDFSTFAEKDSPGDYRRQNQANHHDLNDNIGMMIHTPNGEIRLHQIITHAVSPGRQSQNLSTIISKRHRIDSGSH
jgi:hypothetical protein